MSLRQSFGHSTTFWMGVKLGKIKVKSWTGCSANRLVCGCVHSLQRRLDLIGI